MRDVINTYDLNGTALAGFHYYIRDSKNRPVITVVVVKHPTLSHVFYRGVAICSLKDNPNKFTGRTRAIGRAFRMHRTDIASTGHMRMKPIYREAAGRVLSTIPADTSEFFGVSSIVPFGKQAKLTKDDLTTFEKEMFTKGGVFND